MKKVFILAMALLFSAQSFASVVVHQDVFSLEDTKMESESFYGRLYKWSAWKKTEASKAFDVSPNPIKQAYEADMQEENYVELTENQFEGVFSGDKTEVLMDYYFDTDPIEKDAFCFMGEDCYNPYGEIVFNAKVAISLESGFSIKDLNLKSLTARASAADSPHMYTKISKSFAKGFMNPVHLGQEQISSHPNDEIYMSLLDFGGEYYQCTRLNKALNINANGILEGLFNPYRVYNINIFKELSSEDISKNPIIEGAPLRVFEQRIVSSTDLIKSAVTYMAFYEQGDGSKKMVVYSAVVSTSKVGGLVDMYVNGLDGEAPSSILFNSEKFALLNAQNLDLRAISGNCSKGLGPGVGRYVYGLAKKFINQ